MKKNKILIIIAASVLGISFILFTCEKLHVTNFFEKPNSAVSDKPRPVNSVDYTTQTSPPDPTINSEKNPSNANTTTNPNPNKITVTIIRTNQDTSTRNLNVGVLVYGTKIGACKLELIKNSTTLLSKTAEITEQSGLTTCAGFTVLANEIPSSDTYTIRVSVGDASASQNQELTK